MFVSFMFNIFARHLQDPTQDILISVVIPTLVRARLFSQLALTVFWKDFRPSTGVALLQLVEESSICVFKAAWRRNFLLPAI